MFTTINVFDNPKYFTTPINIFNKNTLYGAFEDLGTLNPPKEETLGVGKFY